MTLIDILKFVIEFLGVSSVLYLIYIVFLRYKCRYNIARIYLLLIPIVALLSVSFTFKVIPLSENSENLTANTQFQQFENSFNNFIGETKEIVYSESATQVAENRLIKTPSNTLSEKIDSETKVLSGVQVPSGVNYRHRNIFDIVSVLGMLYSLILVIMALGLFFQVRKILSIKRWATCEKLNGVLLHRSGLVETPFSFMRDIFVDRGVEGSKLQMIVQHEQSHIANLHYLDKNIVELMSVVMWFNPIVWLIRNELGAIHEFQADNSVIRAGADVKIYQHHLFEEIMYKSPHIANGFNHSLIKKRMIMMKNSKVIKHMALRVFVSIALLIGVFVLVSFKYIEPKDKIETEVKKEQVITTISNHNVTEKKENVVDSTNVVLVLNSKDIVINTKGVEITRDVDINTTDVVLDSITMGADIITKNVVFSNEKVENYNFNNVVEQDSTVMKMQMKTFKYIDDDEYFDVQFVKDSLLSSPDATKLQQQMQMIKGKLFGTFETFVSLVNGNSINDGIDHIEDNDDIDEFQQQSQVLNDNDENLIGTWKLKSRHTNPTNDICYKILKEDNTFINFRSDDGGKTFQTKHEGEYEVLISGIYVERMNGSKHVAATIAYERNNDYLELEFSLGETFYSEVWENVGQTPIY